jgi:hypothetical protein
VNKSSSAGACEDFVTPHFSFAGRAESGDF